MTNAKRTFKVAVQQAFKDTKYPQGESLVQASYGYYGVHVNEFFLNHTWLELVDKEFLGAFAMEMYVLTDEAFAYFLPAVLLNIHTEYIGIQPLIYTWLSPPTEPLRIPAFEQTMSLFTLEQCRVILRFIKSFLKEEFYEYEDKGEETIRYWKKLIKAKKVRS